LASTSLLLALAAALQAPVLGAPPSEPASFPAPLVLRDVRIVPLTGDAPPAERCDVFVAGRRIVAVSPAGAPAPPAWNSEDAREVAGGGAWLMPGLVDAHAHLPAPDAPDSELERVLALHVAHGVTSVRVMAGSGDQLALRGEIASGRMVGPRLFLAGPSVNGRSAPSATAAAAMVGEQTAAGFDWIKLHPGLGAAAARAAAETAEREGLPLAGHVPASLGLREALRLGLDSIEHADGFVEALQPMPGRRARLSGSAPPSEFFGVNLVRSRDEAGLGELVSLVCRSGASVTPTLALVEVFVGRASVDELRASPAVGLASDGELDLWRGALGAFREATASLSRERAELVSFRRDLVRRLHRAGVPLLVGTDSPQLFTLPGAALHTELEALVGCGLTPREALSAATWRAAEALGGSRSFGRVAEGFRADLVLLRDDPIADLGASEGTGATEDILGVVLAGAWFDRVALRRLLER